MKRPSVVSSSMVTLSLRCEPESATTPHIMGELADGAIAFVCCDCGTATVLREEPAGEPVSAI